jgi:hypothetical protein
MKSRARLLIEKSVDAMIAALEVYNKPAFGYREEAFAILAVNAWELLFKARILQLDGNRIAAILEYERRQNADGKPSTMLYRKKNRAGNYLTAGLFRAFDRLVNDYKDAVDPAVRANLEALVEIRDNSVHFMNKDFDLAKAIHEIGAAALKNYVGLARQWFAVDFSQYRLFLMPLAFLSAPSVVEGLAMNPQERHLLDYLGTLHKDGSDDPSKDFNSALTIEVQVKRTKNTSAAPVVISNAPHALPPRCCTALRAASRPTRRPRPPRDGGPGLRSPRKTCGKSRALSSIGVDPLACSG